MTHSDIINSKRETPLQLLLQRFPYFETLLMLAIEATSWNTGYVNDGCETEEEQTEKVGKKREAIEVSPTVVAISKLSKRLVA